MELYYHDMRKVENVTMVNNNKSDYIRFSNLLFTVYISLYLTKWPNMIQHAHHNYPAFQEHSLVKTDILSCTFLGSSDEKRSMKTSTRKYLG